MVEMPVWMNSSGYLAGYRVDGCAADGNALIGDDFGQAVDGLTDAVKAPPDHLFGDA